MVLIFFNLLCLIFFSTDTVIFGVISGSDDALSFGRTMTCETVSLSKLSGQVDTQHVLI